MVSIQYQDPSGSVAEPSLQSLHAESESSSSVKSEQVSENIKQPALHYPTDTYHP